jgi:uncharacterized protein (TIGR03083 family)
MERVTARELIATIRRDRDRFDAALARVPAGRLEEPSLPGGWSVKDVLAHIAWADRENAGVARARALIGSALWKLSDDERNEIVVRESRSRPLDVILADYRRSFVEYITAMAAMSDDELNDADRVDGLGERILGWRPWRVLYDPDHYRDHRQAIEAVFGRGEAPDSD